MKSFNFYELPDGMDVGAVKAKFKELLDYAEKENADREIIAEELSELADRQWHTYEMIDENTKRRIESWIQENWKSESKPFIWKIGGVIGHLGLTASYKLLKSSLSEDLPNDIKQRIELMVKDFGDDVSDPYQSLRKFEKKSF